MADVAVGKFVSTEEPLADERVVEMDSTMRKLDPDQTQFTTMTSRTKSRVTLREKANWLEEQYVNNVFTLDATHDGAVTTISVSAADAASILPNDILRNMTTGEAYLVNTVNLGTGDLGVVRSIGNAIAASGAIGNKLLFVGSAFPQGAALPDMKYSQRVLGFNYTQIFRTAWIFAETTAAIELYGGREPAKEGARKTVEHKRELEQSGFFGGREWITTGTAPQGMAGGLIEFITSNKADVNGELTSDYLDQFLATVLGKGSSDKVIYCGTIAAYYISRFNRSGQGAFWRPGRESVHGVKVDGFISGVYGYEIPVVVKKEWSALPSGDNGYNGNLFVVDVSNVEQRPLRDRSTKLLMNRQAPGDDQIASEYLTEQTWEIAQEKTHGVLTGIS